MRLLDLFTDALTTVSVFIQTINSGTDLEHDKVRIAIERSLTESDYAYVTDGYSEEQYLMAKYAVVAYIDEALTSTGWEHKRQWQKEMLQAEYFQTVSAGEGFFERLSALTPMIPGEKEIREVYYYCLVLGFKGKYFSPDQAPQLEEIKRTTRGFLVSDPSAQQLTGKDRLFPQAYAGTGSGAGVTIHKDFKALYFGLPVIVMIGLFFLFKSKILNAANYFVTTL